MPMYEFTCQDCKEKFEVICQPENKATIKCSVCDSAKVSTEMTAHKSYRIMGPNYGSTPKRGKK